jgi:hypothetical protein
MHGSSFLKAFERRVKISFYKENFCEVLEKLVKERSGNGHLSP